MVSHGRDPGNRHDHATFPSLKPPPHSVSCSFAHAFPGVPASFEIPVEQPTKFDLVLNLRTAKALSLDLPWFLEQRADEVIE